MDSPREGDTPHLTAVSEVEKQETEVRRRRPCADSRSARCGANHGGPSKNMEVCLSVDSGTDASAQSGHSSRTHGALPGRCLGPEVTTPVTSIWICCGQDPRAKDRPEVAGTEEAWPTSGQQ